MQELIPINIFIGDRPYRIKVLPKDEEVVRRTVKTINDKISEFKTQFAGKDMQDYVSMVLVWFATQVSAGEGSSPLGTDTLGKLQSLEEQLDAALKG